MFKLSLGIVLVIVYENVFGYLWIFYNENFFRFLDKKLLSYYEIHFSYVKRTKPMEKQLIVLDLKKTNDIFNKANSQGMNK